MTRSFLLEEVDRSEYDSFTLLYEGVDAYGRYWVAHVIKDGREFDTGNYYSIVPEPEEDQSG